MGHHGRDLLRALFGSRRHGHHDHYDDHHDYHHDPHYDRHHGHYDPYYGDPRGAYEAPPYPPQALPTRRAPAATRGVVCAGCGAANGPDARFCATCGAALAQPAQAACTTCGAALPPAARFCATCGAAVGGGPNPAPAG